MTKLKIAVNKLSFWVVYFSIIAFVVFHTDVKYTEAYQSTPPAPTITQSTIDLIKSFEGHRNRPYYDSEGWLTTGVGHLIKPHENHLVNAVLTDDQVHDLLRSDLRHCEGAIERSVRVSITQNQFDALASLCFNIGSDRFRLSNVVFHLNKGEFKAAANAFLEWSRPAVLIRRRHHEKALFLTDI